MYYIMKLMYTFLNLCINFCFYLYLNFFENSLLIIINFANFIFYQNKLKINFFIIQYKYKYVYIIH